MSIQQNSPARATMLSKRAAEQRGRFTCRWRFVRDKLMRISELRMPLIPAWLNRRTGRPHEHKRAKARRLSQAAA